MWVIVRRRIVLLLYIHIQYLKDRIRYLPRF